jgi:hypothetical protein
MKAIVTVQDWQAAASLLIVAYGKSTSTPAEHRRRTV